MKLYTYFRSSASFRVRIALALKGLQAEMAPIHLLKGEQHDDAYRAVNPQRLVPSLVTEDGAVLTQSLAILEYLEETHPHPPLLPSDTLGRARVRALAQAVACDIHPLNTPRVTGWLQRELGADETAKQRWYAQWITEGFAALEALLDHPSTGVFCHGDAPGMADCCLVPQIFNARRFKVPMDAFPRLARLYQDAMTHPAFLAASPQNQPDAE